MMRIQQKIGTFAREDGSTLVEFAIALPLFLLLFFALLDFGRLGFQYVMAEKANAIAARIAVVRPPACANVPTVNSRGTVAVGTTPPPFGTNCSSASNICSAPATVSCAGSMANATVSEIWNDISVFMPANATAANLTFSYAYDSDLGFLGGPYVPLVTVQISNVQFQFVTPLGALATLAGSKGAALPSSLPFPPMSVTLTGEDLAQGGGT